MNPAIVYHWWGYPSDAPPIANLRSPIMASIGTLRGVNPTVPIYVIDVSDEEQDWMNYPEQLGFRVIQKPPYLKKYKDKEGYRNLSRQFDLARMHIQEDDIIYVDSDVFFIQNPIPLEQPTSRFCFNKYNSGFYYFNLISAEFKEFQEVFEAYIITALNDENFRCITKQFGSCNDYFVLDETMMYYMYVKHPHFFNIVQPVEHFTMSTYENRDEYDQFKLEEVKMFHGNGTMVNNKFAKHQYEEKYSRGLICLGLSQLYQNLQRGLGSANTEQMFNEAEREAYLSHQMNFDDQFIARMIENKGESGHFYFSEALGIV